MICPNCGSYVEWHTASSSCRCGRISGSGVIISDTKSAIIYEYQVWVITPNVDAGRLVLRPLDMTSDGLDKERK